MYGQLLNLLFLYGNFLLIMPGWGYILGNFPKACGKVPFYTYVCLLPLAITLAKIIRQF